VSSPSEVHVPTWGRHGRPLILGHRGASAHALENTLEAFALADRMGADGVELDAMRCKTGEIVVFHDDDLARLAGRPDKIYDLPLAAVREVRLAGGLRIPTLDEVIDVLGPRPLINVELKTPIARGAPDRSGVRLAEGVARVLARHGNDARILVSSFNPVCLGRFRTISPLARTGLLFHADQPRPLREAWAAPALRPTALHPDRALCHPAAVARWRSRYLVHVWTVDDPVELRALAAMGVDGLICNDPASAIRTLGTVLQS
jgi:glycerophosphoryl diester phosphodiesterase